MKLIEENANGWRTDLIKRVGRTAVYASDELLKKIVEEVGSEPQQFFVSPRTPGFLAGIFLNEATLLMYEWSHNKAIMTFFVSFNAEEKRLFGVVPVGGVTIYGLQVREPVFPPPQIPRMFKANIAFMKKKVLTDQHISLATQVFKGEIDGAMAWLMAMPPIPTNVIDDEYSQRGKHVGFD